MKGTNTEERAVHLLHLLLPPLSRGSPSASGCT